MVLIFFLHFIKSKKYDHSNILISISNTLPFLIISGDANRICPQDQTITDRLASNIIALESIL
jgi:hypothetical protein